MSKRRGLTWRTSLSSDHVADFDAWRPVYDGDWSGRQAAGVSDIAVLRNTDDPNSVWPSTGRHRDD